jgi:hypothetical protein
MHSPLENVGSFQGEGQHAHHERQQQQDHISDIETEDDGLARNESDEENHRDRQADARERGSQRQIDRALKLVSPSRADGGEGFGRQDQYRHK